MPESMYRPAPGARFVTAEARYPKPVPYGRAIGLLRTGGIGFIPHVVHGVIGSGAGVGGMGQGGRIRGGAITSAGGGAIVSLLVHTRALLTGSTVQTSAR